MAQNSLDELAKETFLLEIQEIADEQGVTTDMAFARWICRRFIGLDEDTDIDTAVAIGGPGDRDVDFFWNADEGDRTEQFVCWGQAKYSENLNRVFDSAMLDHFAGTIDRLENTPNNANRTFHDRSEQFKRLGGVDSPIAKKMIVAVAGTINDQVREDLREGSSWRVQHLSNASGPKIELEVIDLERILLNVYLPQTGPVNVKFDDTVLMRQDSVTARHSIVGFINANEIIKIRNSVPNTLFSQNVRQALGEGTHTNKQIIKTLKDPQLRQKFWKLNNGVTATCDKLEAVSGSPNEYRILNFNIVNGRQTTFSLERNRGSVDNTVIVGLTVHEAIDDAERNLISEATNTQNPVKPVDLVTNFPEQFDMEQQCKNSYPNYFYERQTKGFDFPPTTPADRVRITKRRKLEKNKTARAYYAYAISAYKTMHLTDAVLFDAALPQNYHNVYQDRQIKDLIVPHIFLTICDELVKTWNKQIKQNESNQPIENQELWNGNHTSIHKEILNKRYIKYCTLQWINHSMNRFSDDDKGSIENTLIEEFGNLTTANPIPVEFFLIVNAAYNDFMNCFNFNQALSWPRDENGNPREPSPVEIKDKIFCGENLIQQMIDYKETFIARLGDPIEDSLRHFLHNP